MNYISDIPKKWAADQARTEAESFEQALKRITPEQKLISVEEENGMLRERIQRLEGENQRLREALVRQSEDYYE